ncbi:MAG: hypothetical protein IJI41_14710 [Anaerolineaceae bacterium]|nr:hypothetical protein [Anaerolineaceae bacterium]
MINTKPTDRNVSLLEETFDMLRKLDFQELEMVQNVIRTITSKEDDYYKPLSETEIISRIDEAIAQVDAGYSYDAEEVEKEIIAEYGL